jgi:hypothetical protein
VLAVEPELDEVELELVVERRFWRVLAVELVVVVERRFCSVLAVDEFVDFFLAFVCARRFCSVCFVDFVVLVPLFLAFAFLRRSARVAPVPETLPPSLFDPFLPFVPDGLFDDEPPPIVCAVAAAAPAMTSAATAAMRSRFERQNRRVSTVFFSAISVGMTLRAAGGASSVGGAAATDPAAISVGGAVATG